MRSILFVCTSLSLSSFLECLKRGGYQQYTHEDLLKAVNAVRAGTMSRNRAASTFGAPAKTITDRVSWRVALEVTASGPSPVLTHAEEQQVKDWVLEMARIGFPVTRLRLKLEIKSILEKDQRENPFTNNMPGMLIQ